MFCKCWNKTFTAITRNRQHFQCCTLLKIRTVCRLRCLMRNATVYCIYKYIFALDISIFYCIFIAFLCEKWHTLALLYISPRKMRHVMQVIFCFHLQGFYSSILGLYRQNLKETNDCSDAVLQRPAMFGSGDTPKTDRWAVFKKYFLCL